MSDSILPEYSETLITVSYPSASLFHSEQNDMGLLPNCGMDNVRQSHCQLQHARLEVSFDKPRFHFRRDNFLMTVEPPAFILQKYVPLPQSSAFHLVR